jgi:hypothetical protein
MVHGVQAAEPVVLTFDQPEMAGISGFRAMWDSPIVLSESGVVEKVSNAVGGGYLEGPSAFWSPKKRKDGELPGALVFDAVHRSLLVRFPGAADKVAAKVSEGYAIAKVELVLPFRNTELWPEAYQGPAGASFLRDEWVKIPPNWHAVAWALRKPWKADPALGPTYNAFIAGAGYWSRFGAQDTNADRYPLSFGPTEVSWRESSGYRSKLGAPAPVRNAAGDKGLGTPDTPPGEPARMDVTAALTNAAFGRTLAERLRQFEDCGLLIRKWEVYDARYHTGTYEWSVATGRRGILIRTPKLAVTLAPDPKAEKADKLPPPADIQKTAEQLKSSGKGGAPTAVMPTPRQIADWADRFGFKRPEGMADWQWKRVQELKALGGGWSFPQTPQDYTAWIDDLLSTPPRQWLGHATPRKAINAMRFKDALPEVVRENEYNYFAAWVMPDMRTEDMDHPQAIAMWYGGTNRHWEATHDWRGNQSYYRAGYTRRISTQNINHLGASGALFGGALVGSQYAMQDGRYGLEHFPLRLWAWRDGTTQESIDHYYLQLTLWTQKEFADFGPTHLDRMMGHSMLAKTMEEVTSSYHPGLRRFISPANRTDLAAVLVTQTGLRYILHTLSRGGTLSDIDNKNTFGMEAMNKQELPPGYVADEMLLGPWAPEWASYLVDEKPIPYELTSASKDNGAEMPVWKRSYLGRHYGLTSRDWDTEDAYHFIQAMAQWRREDKPADKMDEIVTMFVRPEADQRNVNWYGSRQWTDKPPLGGLSHNFQYRNKLIALTSPVDMRKKVAPSSLQTELVLFNFQATPTWEVYVDGRFVKDLPLTVKASQRIIIKDGVTYVGIVPIPATDLGRDAEVVLSAGLSADKTNYPGLLIRNYMLKRDAPADTDKTDWDKVDHAYGGFVIELGDAAEYADFNAFQKHIAEAKLENRWDEAAGVAHLKYTSGKDVMEAGYCPGYAKGTMDKLFPYRKVNGAWPYPAKGIDRDSTLAQQGSAGRLEKGGAAIQTEPGCMAYLQTEPTTRTYSGWNPLPDPAYWCMTVPGGVRVEADGKVSIFHAEVQPAQKRVTIDCAAKDDQVGDDMASAALLFGFDAAPSVTLNGKPLPAAPAATKVGEETAYIVPLTEKPLPPAEVAARYTKSLPLRKAAFEKQGASRASLRDEAKDDSYILSVPRSGTWRFQRYWPTPSVIDAQTPEAWRIATDGRVALLRMDVNKAGNQIAVDLPPYEQNIPDLKAKALLVFGAENPPVLVVSGKRFDGLAGKAKINGQDAVVFPLFGETPDGVLKDLSLRYTQAMKLLQ